MNVHPQPLTQLTEIHAADVAGTGRTLAQHRITELAKRVLDGGAITYEEAVDLINIETPTDIVHLIAWANQIRCFYHHNRIRLCSIVNIKAGGCPEDCKFCAQSAFYQTPAPRHELIPTEKVLQAAKEVAGYGVRRLGIVAAWSCLKEGRILDQICEQITVMATQGAVEPHASLGMIRDQKVADRLSEAGLRCYNHNLETSRRFFPHICSTHRYDDRIQTIQFLKQAGIRTCCGGIIGLGETREDRIQLAFQLKDLNVDTVPINILNPIPGTPLEYNERLEPMEILKTIACFRFILPRQTILIAGGRGVNLRDLQSMAVFAGANAMIVGNYLTTLNRPIAEDLQMIRDLGMVAE